MYCPVPAPLGQGWSHGVAPPPWQVTYLLVPRSPLATTRNPWGRGQGAINCARGGPEGPG